VSLILKRILTELFRLVKEKYNRECLRGNDIQHIVVKAAQNSETWFPEARFEGFAGALWSQQTREGVKTGAITSI
jgi:hypothetical protein